MKNLRFTPTRVGKTDFVFLPLKPEVRFTPTRVGKTDRGVIPDWVVVRFTPTRVGKTGDMPLKPKRPCRFTPTRVGKTETNRTAFICMTVHPHACGENHCNGYTGVCVRRFTPTRVGKTYHRTGCSVHARGSPPRVWGKRSSQSGGVLVPPVHPHACGENKATLSVA